MGTPGVGSPHTLFLFSTPLTARETTDTVHWPAGRVDGAASFQTQIVFTRIRSTFLQFKGNIQLFITYIKIKKNLDKFSQSHHDHSLLGIAKITSE